MAQRAILTFIRRRTLNTRLREIQPTELHQANLRQAFAIACCFEDPALAFWRFQYWTALTKSH